MSTDYLSRQCEPKSTAPAAAAAYLIEVEAKLPTKNPKAEPGKKANETGLASGRTSRPSSPPHLDTRTMSS